MTNNNDSNSIIECLPMIYLQILNFNWNIINKRKKQTKYNQNIEMKNSLTVARGEWGGDREERVLQERL